MDEFGVISAGTNTQPPPLKYVRPRRTVIRLFLRSARWERPCSMGVSTCRFPNPFLCSYVDGFDTLDEHDLPPTPDLTTYLFHDACWQLLPSRLGVRRGHGSSRVIKLLFQTLCCLPKASHGALLTRHTYYGAARYRRSFGCVRTGYERSLPEHWKSSLGSWMLRG